MSYLYNKKKSIKILSSLTEDKIKKVMFEINEFRGKGKPKNAMVKKGPLLWGK